MGVKGKTAQEQKMEKIMPRYPFYEMQKNAKTCPTEQLFWVDVKKCPGISTHPLQNPKFIAKGLGDT